MGLVVFFIFLSYIILPTAISSSSSYDSAKSDIIDVKGGPDDVVWVVQLSDLHFSVHNPERALDFKQLVPPALSMINPSLVFLTGDLTDGKSKDLLTMKQDEKEWVEYQKVMEDVVKRSGLNKNIFYDVRGNHDNFGVPMIGGSFDFFSTYSLNGQLGRSGPVNSVTVQTRERKLLFVGFDSTMSVGLRGPTNLFGHPTDQILNEIDSALSQWDDGDDSQFAKPVTKISFGHFPLSFSAASDSGKTLKDIFLRHSLSAYLCGHLHTSFGKNLKRHHESSHHMTTQKYLQLNSHRTTTPPPSESCKKNCSSGGVEEFWEWEMGDWRKSRAMRVLAVDRGYVSFLDTDFKSGAKKTIVLPTFPLDSRFMFTTRAVCVYHNNNNNKCEQQQFHDHHGAVRALVFSASPIVSVVARIYDSRPGHLYEVVEASMTRHGSSRGDLYTAPWNYRAFEDPSPDRFWLQIEAMDIRGARTLSELRPFSINGLRAYKNSWTWKEFLVMGCQWADLYYPILFLFYLFTFSILLIPKAILIFTNKRCTYKNFSANGGFVNGTAWALTELSRVVPIVLYLSLGYLFYLILCPWLVGHVLTEGGEKGYMTYKGWVLKKKFNDDMGKLKFHGFPDVMVVVLPHLYFVVLPAVLVIVALAAERGMYQDHLLSLSSKKKDDHFSENKGRRGVGGSVVSSGRGGGRNRISKVFYLGGGGGRQWSRIILLLVSLAICWKHFKNCRALLKAYEMNPIVHFPLYSLSIPLLLAYTFYKTRRI